MHESVQPGVQAGRKKPRPLNFQLDEKRKETIVKKTFVILLLVIFPLVGCSTVPKNGSVLNQKVSEGIQKNQLEVEKIIKKN